MGWRVIAAVVLGLMSALLFPAPAVSAPDADINTLISKLVEGFNSRDPRLIRSIYHQDLRMTSCNAFDRLIGNVVFGDMAEFTFENITASAARILSNPHITSLSSTSRVSVTFVLGWSFSAEDEAHELTLGIRWEVDAVGNTLKVMRQWTKVSESEEDCGTIGPGILYVLEWTYADGYFERLDTQHLSLEFPPHYLPKRNRPHITGPVSF